MRGSRELEQVQTLLKQEVIHSTNHHQQDTIVINRSARERIPTFITAILQLQHIRNQSQDHHTICKVDIH